jgi:hypothetical protein
MLSPARGFLMEKSTAQALPVLQQINASDLKASHESAHATVLVGWILEVLQLRHPTLRSSIRRQHPPSSKLLPPSLLSIFPNTLTHSISSRRWHLQNPTW